MNAPDPVLAVIAGLQQLLGERITTAAAICANHGKDESSLPPAPRGQWCSPNPPRRCKPSSGCAGSTGCR